MLGVTTNAIMYQYPQADLAETIKMLSRDFRLIEIDGNRFVLNDKQLMTLGKMQRVHSVVYRIHAPVFGVNLASNQEDERARSVEIVKHYIEGARKLDSISVNVHAGNMMLDFDPFLQEKIGGRKVFINNSRQSIEELVSCAEAAGIGLTVENMFGPHALGLDPEEMKELISTGAGFCFDCGHAYLSHRLEDFLEQLPSPDYLHLCDSDSRMDHLPVGNGEIDFKTLLKKLKPKTKDAILEIISTHDRVRRSKEIIEGLMG